MRPVGSEGQRPIEAGGRRAGITDSTIEAMSRDTC